jgi:hypothetical protein
MSTFTCDVNALMTLATCFQDKCMSDGDRKAIMIYARIKNLAAIGGTDYSANLAQLMIDSANWRKRAEDELRAILTYISLENAINDGASINLNVNSLAAAAACYRAGCLGKEDQNGILAFLGCTINTQTKPD